MAREPDFDAWLDRRTNKYLDEVFGDDEETEEDEDAEGGQADEAEAPQSRP